MGFIKSCYSKVAAERSLKENVESITLVYAGIVDVVTVKTYGGHRTIDMFVPRKFKDGTAMLRSESGQESFIDVILRR